MIANYIDVMKKTVDFTGRARRREYWLFFLANCIMVFVLVLFAKVVGVSEDGAQIILNLFQLAILLPSISCAVRRLHDIGSSGFWFLFCFVPFFGLLLIAWLARDSEAGSNQYGHYPK
ncbi:MAG: DUF805 domain-containing protein [Planctomycetaceae bacterium]|jgi:uncharacterized membrane protein YhaH (DUF805 family)|nr:DUF805 domain-containing protein [Planctomycetaceae bacterium]